jgi:hypothetical protein
MNLLEARRPAVVLEYRGDRYRDPREFLTAIRRVYPEIRHITFDGELRSVADDDVLQVCDSDWMLFLHND